MTEDGRAGIPEYAELRALSNFSFLKGASWPEELVERAKKLGYSALAVCDECSMAGAVRAHVEGKEQGLKVIHGSQFTVACDAPLTFVVLACNVQVIVWRSLKEQQRPEVLRARLLAVYGQWQRQGEVKNLIAHKLADLTPLLGGLATTSRDFH